jgi:subtilase family serine protease
MTLLQGNVHPLAAAAAGTSSPADNGTPMQHMVLYLKGTDAQEALLEQLIEAQSNPKSPQYHQYLTPAQYAAQFGVSQANISVIKTWLLNHGFTVEQVAASNRAIVFSGTAGQVTDTFKTQIHQVMVAGVSHFANVSDPQIPSSLAGAVGGIVKLHNFQHTANMVKMTPVSAAQLANPQYTASSGHYLAPADYGTIYDINPLYKAGINGTGESIAVLARSNINLSDVQAFRSQFGLIANNPQIVVTGTNPGVLQGDSVETTLDTEWAGAIAPNASVKVIVSASTNTADGIDLAAMYAVNNNVAPIISLSYGSCEYDMGSVELSYYNGLWKEAVAQGQTVVVSSGDSGAAGCSSGSSYASVASVNGLCSSTYSTCVGGTEFAEGTNAGQYWLPGNNSGYGSATSYIPEKVWNESALNGGSGSWAGGGGQSINFVKPAYQVTYGVSIDDRRDVPDVSLTAAGHDGYLIIVNGALNTVGGTSAAAPSFAGMMALVEQKTGSKQGNANLILYPLATLQQTAAGAAVFHDITVGNNSVPAVTGFSAATGYDKASGLGSVDAAMMVNHWLDVSATKTLNLSLSSPTLTIALGHTGTSALTAVASAGLTSPVALTMSALPKGVTGGFSTPTMGVTSGGSDLLGLAVSAGATPGAYPITITANEAGVSANITLSLIIPQPNFAVTTVATYSTVDTGSSSKINVLTTPTNGFSGTIALSVAGLPQGITATFSQPSVSGATGGISSLTFTATANASLGNFTVTIIGASGGITRSTPLTLYVIQAGTCTFGSNPTSIKLNAGASLGVALTCNQVQGTFNGPLNVAVTAPSSALVTLSSGTLNPGSTITMNVKSLVTSVTSTSQITVTATGGGFSQTLTIPLAILAAVK